MGKHCDSSRSLHAYSRVVTNSCELNTNSLRRHHVSLSAQALGLRQLSTNEIYNSFFYVFLDRTLAYCSILGRQSPTKFGTAPVLPHFTEHVNRFVPYRILSSRFLFPVLKDKWFVSVHWQDINSRIPPVRI